MKDYPIYNGRMNSLSIYILKQIQKKKRKFKMEKWEYEAVTYLKKAGQTIIDNAEKMVGGYKHQIDDIDIHITLSDDQLPKIEVTQRLVPDNIQRF